MLIIGIGHKKRRGKDTLTAHVLETWSHRLDVRRFAFGDILKEEVNAEVRKRWVEAWPSKLFGAQLAMEEICKWAGVEFERNPDMSDPMCPFGKQRRLLQWWGTEYRRMQFGDSYWVDRLWDVLNRENPQVALIPDTRFPNEADFVKRHNGILVRVQRPSYNPEDNHPSEIALDNYPWDHTVMADTVEELKIAGGGLFTTLFKQRGLI